jgi:hypothetical protein
LHEVLLKLLVRTATKPIIKRKPVSLFLRFEEFVDNTNKIVINTELIHNSD